MINNNPNNKLFDINLILHKIAVREGECVAELGCGHLGHLGFPLAKSVGKNGLLYAVDIIPQCLEEIKRRAQTEGLTQIKTIWSNLEIFKGTKIENSSLDAALLINVLHQSEKKAEIIREASRMLKPGGRILIVDFKNEAILFGPEPKRRLNVEALKEIAPKLSLNIIEEFEAGEQYHGLLLKKL